MNALTKLAEKVIATWVQVFVGLLAVGSTLHTSTAQAAAIAAIPAALTVLANGLPVVPAGLPFYVDLSFRTIRTYVAAFIGFLIAQPVFHVSGSIARAAAVAAIPAALAVVKGAIGSRIGNRQTAAWLPALVDV